MNYVLTIFLYFSFLIHGFIHNEVKKVAVCIGGQTARWQPQHLLDGLLLPNIIDNYHFYMFYNMQMHNSSTSAVVFNTDAENSFTASIISRMTRQETLQYLRSLTRFSPLITVASLKYHTMIKEEKFLRYFKVSSLDRITQYLKEQTTILNMYAKQMQCVEQILKYEKQEGLKFDYIISTREDVFFFRPVNITEIVQQLRHNLSPEALLEADNRTARDTPTRRSAVNGKEEVCDIFYKRCRNFWGFNMRLYILKREVGIQFLGNRFSFYKYLYQINRTVENPERFEYSEASALHFFGCPLSVEDYPVTAIRHYYNGQMCFIFFEIDRCVPLSYHEFAKQHMCVELRRNYFLDKIYSEYPELLKEDFATGIGNISLGENWQPMRKNLGVGILRKYYRQIINHSVDYRNRSAVQEYLQNNYRPAKPPSRLLRYFVADPTLVGLTWIDRDY